MHTCTVQEDDLLPEASLTPRLYLADWPASVIPSTTRRG